MMSDTKTTKEVVISTRTELKIQQQIDEQSELRGHTRSQAVAEIIKLGLPLYLKKFRKEFERVNRKSKVRRAVLNGDSSSVR